MAFNYVLFFIISGAVFSVFFLLGRMKNKLILRDIGQSIEGLLTKYVTGVKILGKSSRAAAFSFSLSKEAPFQSLDITVVLGHRGSVGYYIKKALKRSLDKIAFDAEFKHKPKTELIIVPKSETKLISEYKEHLMKFQLIKTNKVEIDDFYMIRALNESNGKKISSNKRISNPLLKISPFVFSVSIGKEAPNMRAIFYLPTLLKDMKTIINFLFILGELLQKSK